MIRIVESKFITSAINAKGYPDTDLPEFAFVGRSNVGKSSMINTITNRKLLAKIANTPGKTRLINFFDIRIADHRDKMSSQSSITNRKNEEVTDPTESGDKNSPPTIVNSPLTRFCLVDLPGYGYAKVSKTSRDEWKTMINEYFKKRKQLTGVIVLVDIRHEPDPKDMIMIQMLQDLQINFIVAATKCDKIPKSKIHSHLKVLKNGFRLLDDNIYEFSSLKKIGIEKILDWIGRQLTIDS